jgi:hypothetical protein
MQQELGALAPKLKLVEKRIAIYIKNLQFHSKSHVN